MTPNHLTPNQKLALLSKLTHKDNVHYTQSAYGKLAEKVISEAHSGTATAAAPVRSAAQSSQVRWRGFVTAPGVGKTSIPVPAGPAAGGAHNQRRGFGCSTALETGSGSEAGSGTGTGAGNGTRSLSYQ